MNIGSLIDNEIMGGLIQTNRLGIGAYGALVKGSAMIHNKKYVPKRSCVPNMSQEKGGIL